MSNLYNIAAERVFQLLDETRQKWKTETLHLPSLSPNDDFRAVNPEFPALCDRVNEELQYELSDHQCSWAVLMFWKHTWPEYLAAVRSYEN